MLLPRTISQRGLVEYKSSLPGREGPWKALLSLEGGGSLWGFSFWGESPLGDSLLLGEEASASSLKRRDIFEDGSLLMEYFAGAAARARAQRADFFGGF